MQSKGLRGLNASRENFRDLSMRLAASGRQLPFGE